MKHLHVVAYTLMAVVMLFTSGVSFASIERHQLDAVHTYGHMSIDGVLSESAWAEAPELTHFQQRLPNEGHPASLPTSVKILFDEHALYFGAVLYDDQAPSVQRTRRDQYVPTDWFGVLLDPRNDGQTGASFYVSAGGVQLDSRLYNDTWLDDRWDAVWQSEVKHEPGRWTVEIAIPLSQLQFAKDGVTSIRANFSREVARLYEEDWWIVTPRSESGVVSRFGEVAGLHLPHSSGVTASTYARMQFQGMSEVDAADPFQETSLDGGSIGADILWRGPSGWSLSAAVNPDFGQVEVDPAEVNLTQYETFLPEKRPLFTTNADMFSFGRGGLDSYPSYDSAAPPQYFYSRRIGHAPRGQVSGAEFAEEVNTTPIYAALSATHKSEEGVGAAVLSAVTAPVSVGAIYSDGERREVLVEPVASYSVGRTTFETQHGRFGVFGSHVAQQVPESMGWLPDAATVWGVDAYRVLGNRDVVIEGSLGFSSVRGSPEAIQSRERSPSHYFQRPDAAHVEVSEVSEHLTGTTTRLVVARQTGNWRFHVDGYSLSPGFDANDLGYMRRADYLAMATILSYVDKDPGSNFQSLRVDLIQQRGMNYGIQPLRDQVAMSFDATTLGYKTLYGFVGQRFATLDDTLTRGGVIAAAPAAQVANLAVGSDNRRDVVAHAGLDVRVSRQAGDSLSTWASLEVHPTPALSLTFSPWLSYRDSAAQYLETVDSEDQAARTTPHYVFAPTEQWSLDLSTRVDWAATDRLSLQLFMQPFAFALQAGAPTELADAGSYTFEPYQGESYDLTGSELSLLTNAVIRWEFERGSALYLVGNVSGAGESAAGDLRGLLQGGAPSDWPFERAVAIKFVTWWGG